MDCLLEEVGKNYSKARLLLLQQTMEENFTLEFFERCLWFCSTSVDSYIPLVIQANFEKQH